MAPRDGEVVLQVRQDGVALLSFCSSPANALTLHVMAQLKERYEEAMEREDVKAVVLTGGNGKFSGGLHVKLIQNMQETGNTDLRAFAVTNDFVKNVMEDGKKPSVAALQGYARGGGLELAMGCSARIAAPSTQLSLPELSIGVIPGLGGTQRLPRLVGLQKAIDMLMSSRPITSEEGQRLGLVDAIASAVDLVEVASKWALDIAEGRRPWQKALTKTNKLGSIEESGSILSSTRQKFNGAHHIGCLDAIEHGISFGGHAGLDKEEEVFKKLVLLDTARGLCHMFLAQSAISEVAGVTDAGLKPRPIKKVGIVGTGVMVSGIATALILTHTQVVLKDFNKIYPQKGIKKIKENLEFLLGKGKLQQEDMDKALLYLTGVSSYAELGDVDLVIEAVRENLSLKQCIFEEMEKACKPTCIFASNTVSFDLNAVGVNTTAQDRIIGIHFYSPAHAMPLMEIIPTKKTSAQVALDLLTLAKTIKKTPLIVKNSHGFVVNRTFFPYFQAAYLLVQLGVDLFRIDRVVSDFGMPMGPFQLHDVTGYSLAIAFRKQLSTSFPDRAIESPLLELMLKDGREGKVNGRGYYIYEKGSKPKPDASVQVIIDESRNVSGMNENGQKVNTISDREILEMIFFPAVNEACHILEEGVIARASDIDVASTLGMKFPSQLGGLIFWADHIVGAKHIYTSLQKWHQAYGNFFKPSKLLEERATKGIN